MYSLARGHALSKQLRRLNPFNSKFLAPGPTNRKPRNVFGWSLDHCVPFDKLIKAEHRGAMIQQGSQVAYQRANECGCRLSRCPSAVKLALKVTTPRQNGCHDKTLLPSQGRHIFVTALSHLLLPRLTNDAPLCPIQTNTCRNRHTAQSSSIH